MAPDVPGRVERFRRAVRLVAGAPSPVVEGDMVDDLPDVLAGALDAAPGDAHLVVFSSWALTYVDRARRPDVAKTLAAVAVSGRSVTWLTAEPPHCAPGIDAPPQPEADRGQTTVLGLRRWRDGAEQTAAVLGTSHPHGQWVTFE